MLKFTGDGGGSQYINEKAVTHIDVKPDGTVLVYFASGVTTYTGDNAAALLLAIDGEATDANDALKKVRDAEAKAAEREAKAESTHTHGHHAKAK